MGNINKALKRFWRDEQGQSTTEYVLLLLVIVIVVKNLKTVMSGRLNGLVESIFGQAQTMSEGLGD